MQWRRCGTEGLTYQWKKDGEDIPGATSAQLAFSQLQTSQSGSYQVVVRNSYGSVTSIAVNLEVSRADQEAPVITLIGENPLVIYKGSVFSDPGATVSDNVDPTRTITGDGTVDTGIVGAYTLTYTAQDVAGNPALPVTRTVNVVLDPAADEDGDGLTNGNEITGGTNPYQKDSDGDGVNDPVEIADGTNPNDASNYNNLNKGLVAYYPFNGNSDDESGNGRHAVNLGATSTTDRFGVINRAFSFDGQSSYLRVADAPWFPREASEFTLTTWLFIPSVPADHDHKFILTIDAIEQW